MNWFSIALALAGPIVHGIQAVIGDKASGATKEKMALDSLSLATGIAIGVTTGSNATYANAASQIAGLVIKQTVDIGKATGTYAKATAAASAAQQDVAVAQAVDELVKSVQNPTP